ncbi:disintegrin and metalloproteinase domain-containing protein 10-like isoform 1-T1 [Synchiropus picturatus]
MISATLITIVLVHLHCVTCDHSLKKYIRYHEGLSYNRVTLHNSHQRAKRALSSEEKIVRLEFHSHGRQFNLRMTKDVSTFSPDAVEEVDGVEMPLDASHIYSGDIFGEEGSLVHGGVIDGRFIGFIKTHHGTFHVERAEMYFKDKKVPFHSIIYHEDNVNLPHKYEAHGGCANSLDFERMKRYQDSQVHKPLHGLKRVFKHANPRGPVHVRKKRDADKVVCELLIQTDHLFFKKFGSREAVKVEISNYLRAVNEIYRPIDFNGIQNIGFVAKRTKINTTERGKDRSNPFRFANIGIEKFLDLNADQNHDEYCLAYVFTDRDFDDGVLGLAYVGSPSAGICAKSALQANRRKQSLNTGVITIQNYNTYIPDKVKFVTFAHEIGHNFGSKHDVTPACTPGQSKVPSEKANGNFIMFPKATSGDKPNNDKFSPCSIDMMSKVLKSKKDLCFVESGLPICGNKIVEEGEVCDCGDEEECDDPCCYNSDEDRGKRCQLQPGKLCSPSQGPCCTEECTFKEDNVLCREESECAKDGFCNGKSAMCPPSEGKKDLTVCNSDTQVCINGICSGSICQRHGLEACHIPNTGGYVDIEVLCYVQCEEKSNPDSCAYSGSDQLAKHFKNRNISLQPGAPCDDFTGYCDVFAKCRAVDADGPLLILTNALFNPKLYESLLEWVMDFWWATLLIAGGFVSLMALLIKFFSVHTPSSNPSLPPPKHLPDLKRHPGHKHKDPEECEEGSEEIEQQSTERQKQSASKEAPPAKKKQQAAEKPQKSSRRKQEPSQKQQKSSRRQQESSQKQKPSTREEPQSPRGKKKQKEKKSRRR